MMKSSEEAVRTMHNMRRKSQLEREERDEEERRLDVLLKDINALKDIVRDTKARNESLLQKIKLLE